MAHNRGLPITTFTGQTFWPLDPQPEDVHVEDIAHALSLLCRFAGHSRVFYSVAQHSIAVSDLACETGRLHGLLHDAAEAYVVDLPRPIKRDPGMLRYREIEQRVLGAIRMRFEMGPHKCNCIDVADEVMLSTEARDLIGDPWWRTTLKADALPGAVEPWSPEEAERRFLSRLGELSR